MINLVTQFALSAAIVVVAGVFLTRFADGIAEETNLGRLFVGTILLAGATSLPELVVDLNAVARGHADLAVGDLLGSSLFNLLILSALDTAFRPECRAFLPSARAFAPLGMLGALVTAIVGVGIVAGADATFLGVGIFVWLTFAAYALGLPYVVSKEVPENPVPLRATGGYVARKRLLRSGAGYLASTLVLVTVAPYLVEAADGIARSTGAGHGWVGTVLVAFSTSLPELVATLAAMRMNAAGLAIGNIFGSNAFNMALFLPLDAMYKGNLLADARPFHVVTAAFGVVVMSLAVWGQLSRSRKGPHSAAIGAVVLLALVSLYFLRAL